MIPNKLEALYRQYNRREYVTPDPLQFLYEFKDIRDREIVALIASCLAYGRVAQILKSVSAVIAPMKPTPRLFFENVNMSELSVLFRTFVHRFATGRDISALLWGVKKVNDHYGSIYECFKDGYRTSHPNSVKALNRFVGIINDAANRDLGHLLPLPERGSACKRLHLFLRWMVRKDDVDPGGWEDISAKHLVIPLDTHMFRVGHRLKLTKRKSADLKTALQITEGFKRWSPDDPVRYDFTLTRLGIRDDIDFEKVLSELPGSK